jgi:hypothetical protein
MANPRCSPVGLRPPLAYLLLLTPLSIPAHAAEPLIRLTQSGA